MRSFCIGFILAGLILSSASDADAQRTTNKEMHERINALRNRLQNFQLERVRKEPQKVVAVKQPETETVEVKYEQLLEEFESRKDVAVMVLFHDTEFAGDTELKDSPAIVDSEDKIVAQETHETAALPASSKVAQETSDAIALPANSEVAQTLAKRDSVPEPVKSVTGAVIQPELERAQRQEMYQELRRKVQMATRRVHENAQVINDMVAQIP